MNLSASSAKPADPTYFLEGVIHDKSEMADFEGPLSLILLLLSKNKIEIRDIKISEILDQYLEYLNAMEKLDLEIASEFVQMASYLLYIKTRMLLTEEKEVTELEQLIASLEQLKCKDTYAAVVTPMLDAAAQPGLHYLSRPPEPLPKSAGEYRYRIEQADLLRALLSVFTRGGAAATDALQMAAPKRIVYSVRDKCRTLIDELRERGSMSLNALQPVHQPQRDCGDVFVRAGAVQPRPSDAFRAKRRICGKLHRRRHGRYSGIHYRVRNFYGTRGITFGH